VEWNTYAATTSPSTFQHAIHFGPFRIIGSFSYLYDLSVHVLPMHIQILNMQMNHIINDITHHITHYPSYIYYTHQNTSKHITTHHNTAQHITTHHNTAQHISTQHNTSPHITTDHILQRTLHKNIHTKRYRESIQ